jgi:hypothetical protein
LRTAGGRTVSPDATNRTGRATILRGLYQTNVTASGRIIEYEYVRTRNETTGAVTRRTTVAYRAVDEAVVHRPDWVPKNATPGGDSDHGPRNASSWTSSTPRQSAGHAPTTRRVRTIERAERVLARSDRQ